MPQGLLQPLGMLLALPEAPRQLCLQACGRVRVPAHSQHPCHGISIPARGTSIPARAPCP